MDLDLNRKQKKIQQNDFIKNFIQELTKALESYDSKNEFKGKKTDDMELTQEEHLKFYRKKSDFLQEYFKEELSDLSKGEIFLVTNKYENDYEYHRYKVAQYKDNKECKHVAFEKDLPENVEVGDVVRKVDGKYIYDEQATKYVNDSINRFKQDIIISRKQDSI